MVDAPHENRLLVAVEMRQLPVHAGEVAAPVRTPVRWAAAGEVPGDIDRSHPAVVVRGVKNSAVLVDRKVVRSSAVEVEECNLTWRGEVADVHDMDVAARV